MTDIEKMAELAKRAGESIVSISKNVQDLAQVDKLLKERQQQLADCITPQINQELKKAFDDMAKFIGR